MPDPKLRWFHSTERKSVYVEDRILYRTPRAMLPCLRASGRTSWSFQALHMSGRTALRVISLNSLNSPRYVAEPLWDARPLPVAPVARKGPQGTALPQNQILFTIYQK